MSGKNVLMLYGELKWGLVCVKKKFKNQPVNSNQLCKHLHLHYVTSCLPHEIQQIYEFSLKRILAQKYYFVEFFEKLWWQLGFFFHCSNFASFKNSLTMSLSKLICISFDFLFSTAPAHGKVSAKIQQLLNTLKVRKAQQHTILLFKKKSKYSSSEMERLFASSVLVNYYLPPATSQ